VPGPGSRTRRLCSSVRLKLSQSKLTWYVTGSPAAAALARILPTTVADRSVHVILEKPSAASAAPMPLLPQPSSRMASQGLMCGATTCRNSL